MTASARGATPDDLPMMVLDVLRHDIEQIPSILNLLNDTEDIGWRDVWPEDFKESDVVEALRALVRDGSVDVYVEDPEAGELVPSASPMEFERALDDSWFLLTDAGRERWETWDAPIDAGHSVGGASEELTERISQLLRDVAQGKLSPQAALASPDWLAVPKRGSVWGQARQVLRQATRDLSQRNVVDETVSLLRLADELSRSDTTRAPEIRRPDAAR